MYYVKHKTTNIIDIPRGQALYSTTNPSKALWTCDSNSLCDHSEPNVMQCEAQWPTGWTVKNKWR